MALEEYKKKELKQQILDEPDTFVGGCDLIEDLLPIINNAENILTKNIEYVPAINKLFDEILVNARDQKIRLDGMEQFFPIINSKYLIEWETKFPTPFKTHLPFVKDIEKQIKDFLKE